jgi:hypothetical protein
MAWNGYQSKKRNKKSPTKHQIDEAMATSTGLRPEQETVVWAENKEYFSTYFESDCQIRETYRLMIMKEFIFCKINNCFCSYK